MDRKNCPKCGFSLVNRESDDLLVPCPVFFHTSSHVLCSQCLALFVWKTNRDKTDEQNGGDEEKTVKDGKVENVNDWISEDPNNRKRCPYCGILIEKDGGCFMMDCTRCSASFNWDTIEDDESIYDEGELVFEVAVDPNNKALCCLLYTSDAADE